MTSHSYSMTEAESFFAEERRFPFARLLISLMAAVNVASALAMLAAQG